MQLDATDPLTERLAPFAGEWSMEAQFPQFQTTDVRGRTVFFTGTFSKDGSTIAGRWEICHDGNSWEHDFDLTYTKVA